MATILFSASMVRAILDGRKTQTRRAVKISHRTPGLAACLMPKIRAFAAELKTHNAKVTGAPRHEPNKE